MQAIPDELVALKMNPFPNDPQFWDDLPTVRVPLGTKVIAEVTAADCLGGVGKTIGEKS